MFFSLILTDVAYCFPLLEENGSPQGVSFALFETDRYGHKEKKHSSIAMPKFSSLPILSMEKGISECCKKTSEKPVILSATRIFKRKAFENLIPFLSWKDLLVIPHVRTSILGSRLLQSICSTKHHFYTSLKVHHCLVSLDFVQVIKQINEHTYST